jgi:hypothetical protein
MPPNRPCNICPCRIQCLIISGDCYLLEAGSSIRLVRAWLRANLHGAQPAHLIAGQLVAFFQLMRNFVRNTPDYRRMWNYLIHLEHTGMIKMYNSPNNKKWIELI